MWALGTTRSLCGGQRPDREVPAHRKPVLAKITTDFEINSLRRGCNIVTGVKLYPSFGEAQLPSNWRRGKIRRPARPIEMEGLLNELPELCQD